MTNVIVGAGRVMPVSLMAVVAQNSEKLVQPHLVAIYSDKKLFGGTKGPNQVGTGFLVTWCDRPTLITAKHTLYGHNGNENPRSKSVFVNGALTEIGDLNLGTIRRDPRHDLVAVHIDNYAPTSCLPLAAIPFGASQAKLITIHGFLSRDFRRSSREEKLRPKPYVYTDKQCRIGSGYVGIAYAWNRAIDTTGGYRVHTPTPRGLSGCPMLDTAKLALQKVAVIGVFTDKPPERGVAFGESTAKLLALLRSM
jgi:hypothetical protein